MKHNKIILIISFVVSLLLITIGLSFAYFTSNITNTEDSTTIHASGGVMNIHYDGGENINTPNIFPSNIPFAIKNFTLTGKSTTNDNINYHIILVIEENTFTNNAITYKLISNNRDNNGVIAPSTNELGITTGSQEIFLGDGTFESPVDNDVHLYTLELYFPDTVKNQNEDMNKTFRAYINIREGEYDFPGFNAEKGVNHPVLFTGMTPVKWNENNVEINTTETDPDWYDYNEKRWANAKSQDGSYWVWIPRYAYKITSGYHSSTTGTIDVKFLKDKTNFSKENMKIENTGYEAHVKDTSMHHFLHPAFDFDGGYLGFWMAKFEPSVSNQKSLCYTDASVINCNNSINSVKIIPGVNTWRYISIKNAFEASFKMKDNVIYGWHPEEIDSHMMTNLEWGAVAYLSKSQFGSEEEVWNNACNKHISGCSGLSVSSSSIAECEKYYTENGQKASTTHNIYGIYDMSGGAWEATTGNMEYQIGNSGFTESDFLDINKKHIDIYSNNVSIMYGDAVYETTSNVLGYSLGWYNYNSYYPTITTPWYVRGGNYSNGAGAGLFRFNNTHGIAYINHTFRPVLVPIK